MLRKTMIARCLTKNYFIALLDNKTLRGKKYRTNNLLYSQKRWLIFYLTTEI